MPVDLLDYFDAVELAEDCGDLTYNFTCFRFARDLGNETLVTAVGQIYSSSQRPSNDIFESIHNLASLKSTLARIPLDPNFHRPPPRDSCCFC